MSWALVMSHYRDADKPRAGYIDLLMASWVRWRCCSLSACSPDRTALCVDMRHSRHDAPAVNRSHSSSRWCWPGSVPKAGRGPLHVWLPLAHPAAPSHVSGLMSGVMTKVAVYAFIRIVFDLLGAQAGGRR